MSALAAAGAPWAAAALPPALPLGLLAGLLLLSWLLFHLARRQERRNWIYARAPQLPIESLAEHDDAWIRGRIRAERPLACPFFEVPCVWYSYCAERRVTETVTDSEGRTHTETHWEVDRRDEDAAPFELTGGAAAVRIDPGAAEIRGAPKLGPEYSSPSRRHSARILPAEGALTALGVKLEGDAFGPLAEIPLLLTPEEPSAFIARMRRRAGRLRAVAWCLLLAAGALPAFLLAQPAGPGGLAFDERTLLPALLGAAALWLPVFVAHGFNRFVRIRQRLRAARRQIDVDLAVRSDLVGELAAVVRAAAAHEKSLQREIAALRSARPGLARTFLARAEAYPQLKSAALFRDLARRLTALEDKLATDRRLLADQVLAWNDLTGSFPTSILARIFGWRPEPPPRFVGGRAGAPPALAGTEGGR